MNELSLFSGAGGGLLATHHLLGWSTIGYVEIDPYCQRVLRARIDDGLLDPAPIWTDVREFLESGAAREYRGFADVVTAGFPCQPFSQAGKRLGARDDRNLWPETAAVIREVQPRFGFFENTPGIKSYLPVVRDDLRDMGYCVAPPLYASAAIVGAGHIRSRVWLLAYRDGCCDWLEPWRIARAYGEAAARLGDDVAQEWLPFDTAGEGCENGEPGGAGQELSGRLSPSPSTRSGRGVAADSNREGGVQPPWSITEIGGRSSHAPWWAGEPDVERVVPRVPNGVDRGKALGNSQVPAVAALAWQLLSDV